RCRIHEGLEHGPRRAFGEHAIQLARVVVGTSAKGLDLARAWIQRDERNLRLRLGSFMSSMTFLQLAVHLLHSVPDGVLRRTLEPQIEGRVNVRGAAPFVIL